ncbi:hypothetical protein LCGC14_3085200, partial [marine sediment metagenome]
IEHICTHCKQKFLKWEYKIIKNQKLNFCSKKCVFSFKRLNIDTTRRDFRGLDWDVQRNEVLIRDNGICQKCENSNFVVVHHIIPWRVSKNNDLSNLICVCPKCHMTEENHYRQFRIPTKFMRDKIMENNVRQIQKDRNKL